MLIGLHGIMQFIGNCATEEAVSLAVEGLQRTGRKIHGQFAGQEQILVKNKLHFRILLAVALYKTRACVDLGLAACSQIQFLTQGIL